MIYGDPAYGVNEYMSAPFGGNNLSDVEKQFNRNLSKVRVSVEWLFGVVKGLWAFIDWNKKHKILLSPVAKLIKISVLLTNCHTCIKGGNQLSYFFDCPPPTLDEYLN